MLQDVSFFYWKHRKRAHTYVASKNILNIANAIKPLDGTRGDQQGDERLLSWRRLLCQSQASEGRLQLQCQPAWHPAKGYSGDSKKRQGARPDVSRPGMQRAEEKPVALSPRRPRVDKRRQRRDRDHLLVRPSVCKKPRGDSGADI